MSAAGAAVSIHAASDGLVSYDQTAEFNFHGVEYSLHAFVQNGDTLCIEAEQKSNGNRWIGSFSSANIEAITKKTENSKKFPVFVKMLSTALARYNDTVFIDLLTNADLEVLKARKNGMCHGM